MPNVFWAAFAGAAAAGLITLVAVLTAEWFRWFIDRPLVRVTLRLGYLIGVNDSTRYVFYEATNPHSKPVTLSTFGLLFRRKQWGKLQVMPQPGYAFPYELGGGKSFTQWAAMSQLIGTLKSQGRVPSDLKWVYFAASSGKLYCGKIEKWLIEELEREFGKTNGN